jgi:hypothetical protein
VCHVERVDVNGTPKDVIELDAIDVRYAADEDKDFFSPEEIATWIHEYTKKFFIVKGLMDQYYGMAILPLLAEKGVKQIDSKYVSRNFSSQVYQNLMSKMLDASLRIPESEPREVKGKKTTDLPLIDEMLTLQATYHSKNLITVKAPEIKGMHDDLSDAFSRAVWLATEFMNTGSMVAQNVTTSTTRGIGTTYKKYLRKQRSMAAYTHRPSSGLQSDLNRQRSISNSLGLMRR